MTKKNGLLLIYLFPFVLFGQSSLFSDTTSAKIIKRDCDDRLFTKVEVLPSLKVSKETFEDTLRAELKSRKFSLRDNEITCQFIVTCQSQILDLGIFRDVKKGEILKEAILHFADLWIPAKQHGHAVCAYVRLKMVFSDDRLNIDISQ